MSKGTPGRMIRVSDDVWKLFQKICKEEGTTASADIRRFVKKRLNKKS